MLDEGRVVERGTHEGSLAPDGLYANLWGVQPGEIESLSEASLARTAEQSADRRT